MTTHKEGSSTTKYNIACAIQSVRAQNRTSFPRLIKMDRVVGFEPTTLAEAFLGYIMYLKDGCS
jgi:hypothetical protein